MALMMLTGQSCWTRRAQQRRAAATATASTWTALGYIPVVWVRLEGEALFEAMMSKGCDV